MSDARRSMPLSTASPVSPEGMEATYTSGSISETAIASDEVARLVERSRAANDALMRGDVDRYRASVALADDFTLMSPFGGAPTRGSEMTDERWQAMARFFRNGGLDVELIQSYASADMIALAVIERAHGEVGGLPAQDWPLRVTLVYRRDGARWRLVHRHADPLVTGITLHHAAALARGETR